MIASLFRERILPPPECDAGLVKALAGSLSIPERIAAVLCARGLTNAADVRAFFNPALTQLHSPFLFRDMEKAVEKIVSVLKGRIDQVGDESDEKDPIFEKAVELILFTGQASASYLQRKLKLGYARAARIIDQMEQEGIVGPSEGSKPREILIDRDAYMRQLDGEE